MGLPVSILRPFELVCVLLVRLCVRVGLRGGDKTTHASKLLFLGPVVKQN